MTEFTEEEWENVSGMISDLQKSYAAFAQDARNKERDLLNIISKKDDVILSLNARLHKLETQLEEKKTKRPELKPRRQTLPKK